MPGRRPWWARVWDAIVHPDQWDVTPSSPDVVSEQPPAKKAVPARKAPAKRAPAKRAAPAKKVPAKKVTPPAPVRTRIIPRNELPAEWGPNEAAYWQDATKTVPELAKDWEAQALYDAALYTFSETTEVRRAILDTLFTHIESRYGVDFRRVFDWQGYRENYDDVAIDHGGDFTHGGNARN